MEQVYWKLIDGKADNGNATVDWTDGNTFCLSYVDLSKASGRRITIARSEQLTSYNHIY
jgi:hypothetical protein